MAQGGSCRGDTQGLTGGWRQSPAARPLAVAPRLYLLTCRMGQTGTPPPKVAVDAGVTMAYRCALRSCQPRGVGVA